MSDTQPDTQRLYLIDGSGFIFRAYYGLRAAMRAADGTPTNAVYGFTRLLLNVIRDRQPSHVAVVFDAKGDTFRHDMYPEYKANRGAPPDDLIPQFPLCREITTALGIPALELDRYEADDLIGTLARQWTATGRECVVVTADKDMMQLVDDLTWLWDGKDKETRAPEVMEKFGVAPNRVIDILGLSGDSSDNIPGVPGIGPKTATLLLQEHGDMETLLAVAAGGGIKGKRGVNLVEFAESARLSRELATINCASPITLDEAATLRSDPDPDVLAPFLRQLNFKQFLKEFKLEEHTTVELDRSAYQLINTPIELGAAASAARAAGRLGISVETTAGNAVSAEFLGVALAWAPGAALYVPIATGPGEAGLSPAEFFNAFGALLADPSVPITGPDLKRVMQIISRRLGGEVHGLRCDTELTAYLIDPNRSEFTLPELSRDLIGHAMVSLADVAHKKAVDLKGVPAETAYPYAAEKADVALQLDELLMPKLSPGLQKLNDEVELPLLRVLARIELTGIRLDGDKLAAQSAKYGSVIDQLEVDIHELAGGAFNIGSPKQLQAVLFEKLQLPTERNTKMSTNAAVLKTLSSLHPLPAKVLEYRHLAKLKNTYLDVLPGLINPETGRLHTSFNQAVAATGRISSSDPNLQNIPVRTPEGRAIREAFVAEPGWKLVSADYSQVELRLLAHYSEDPGLLAAFREEADVHLRTAAEVFNLPEGLVTPLLRSRAKAVNFGLMYGMAAFRLSNDLGIPQRDATEIIERYFKRYAGVKRYFDEAKAFARKHQRAETLFGRVRPLPEIKAGRFQSRSASERLAVNTPIQGSAADILKIAMVNLDRRLVQGGYQARILLTVHDELVLEVPEAELGVIPGIVREEMEGAVELRVPLKVDVGVGDNWATIH